MTYDSMRTTGRGNLVTFLVIGGIPWVFSDFDIAPIDAWYTAATPGFSGVKPWLVWEGRTHEESCSFIDGTLEVEPIKIEMVDVDGGFTALIKEWRARNYTVLTSTYAAGSVVAMQVESITGFTAPTGTVHIGREAIYYNGVAAGQLGTVSVIRGAWGSLDEDHIVDTGAEVAVLPKVADGPTFLANRRAWLYAAEYDSQTGTVGASECIFRGYVASDVEGGLGMATLQIDHISRTWSRNVAEGLPQTSLKPGYWYSGGAHPSLSSVVFQEKHDDTGVSNTAEVTIPQGRYDSAEHLIQTMEAQIRTTLAAVPFNRTVRLFRDTGSYETPSLYGSIDANWLVYIRIREGDPLWAMGFDPGTLLLPVDSASDVRAPADNPARLFCMEVPDSRYTDNNAVIEVFDGTRLTEDQYIRIGKNPFININNPGISGNLITLELDTADDAYRLLGQEVKHHYVDDPEEMVVQHVLAWKNIELETVLGQLLGITGSIPYEWRLKGWESADISTAELGTILDYVPRPLGSVRDCITEATALDEIICDRLGVLGIAPVLRVGGAIGFQRLSTPNEDDTETAEIDSTVWSHEDAAQVRVVYEGEPLVNAIELSHTYNYMTGAWADNETRLLFRDAINDMGKTRTKIYQLRGVVVSGPYGSTYCYGNREDLIRDVQVFAVGCHFGIYGRLCPVVNIPCTWLAKQEDFECGNLVKLTHPVVIDPSQGDVGVDSRVVVPLRRRLSITEEGSVEAIQVLLPRVSNSRPIAPCALATSWAAGPLQLTFASTVLFSADDLSWFAIGDFVMFERADVRAPPALWGPSRITAIGAGTVTIAADPFAGAFPAEGVIMKSRDWDNATTKFQAYLFFADTNYSLGAGNDDGHHWGL